jgi:hypothetical protein
MTHRHLLAALLLAAALEACSTAPTESEVDTVDLGSIREEHVMIPMRDGVRLSAYLYFPEGEGPWPVLYEQRYADLRADRTRKDLADLASHGYVVCAENFRGAHLSEGTWNGYRALGWGELQDGYDTVEWLAEQRWSDGKVGTFGASQGGYAQNFLAVTQPPHLVTQHMVDTGLSLFHEGYRIGGATKPGRFKTMARICRVPEHNAQWLRETFEHPTYDEYWQAEDCARHFDKMNVPTFTIGSWYDYMSVGSIDSFVGRQHHGGPNSRGSQQLMLGPWLHGRYNKQSPKVGELEYPENSTFDVKAHMIRWFDHYLKGIDNGVDREPAARYYVMGAVGEPDAPGNEWRTADDWPIPVRETSYYLTAADENGRGGLALNQPTSADATTTYVSDPANPAPIPVRAFPGARDARKYEQHSEPQTFTTAPLTEPVEWTGSVRVELYISANVKDADYIVRLSDVYPDGRSILIMDKVQRARFRDGFEREVMMEPGKVYKFAFDIHSLSQVFNKGHRIRVTVGSTGAEFYEPNPNTGGPMTIEPPAEIVVAENTIHHSRRHGSRILAPVAGGN